MSGEMTTTRRDGQPGTAITKNAIGDQTMTATGETSSTSLAARETAQVQARIIQAMKRPRVFEEVRERFIGDCDRPRFALVARYERPQGWVLDENNRPVKDANGEKIRNYIRGWSIRAIESAIQAMGNIDCTATTLFEDDRKEIVKCKVWDLERNMAWESEVVIEKTVERKFLSSGQRPLATRTNSYGDPVYILPATDDETRLKKNRMVSMTLRTLGLRVVPGDLLDEALERVERARLKAKEAEKGTIAADPKAAMRALLDRLAAIGIRAADVVEFFGGRSIESVTPDQILELRIIGADVTQGNYTWRDALAGSPYIERAEGEEKPEDEKTKATREKIEAKLKATKEKKAGTAPPAAPPGDAPTPEPRPTPKPEAPPAAEERQPGAEG